VLSRAALIPAAIITATISLALAAMLAAGALLGAGVVHADPSPDQIFLSDLTWHGVGPKDSSERASWEQEAISAGHEICGMLADAPPYEARRDVEHDLVRYHHMDTDLAHTMVNAAVDAYCPQFKAD
jgi:Protein of unknown function (DUF732)